MKYPKAQHLPPPFVLSFLSADDLAILALAETEQTTGSDEADKLILELEAIGHEAGFLKPTKTKKNAHLLNQFNANNHHVRAKEIGSKLNEIGGIKLMALARHRVARKFKGARRFGGRELDFCWDGIGAWSS